MAKAKDDQAPKRMNRTVGMGDALAGVLGPALRKRGFASRDLITHWAAMAPAPYDRIAAPDKLTWPRGSRGEDGATLYLRCAEGHALALQHEGQTIAAAINRYFGYLVVKDVRMSLTPFSAPAAATASEAPKVSGPLAAKVGEAVAGVDDSGVQAALRALGEAVLGKKNR